MTDKLMEYLDKYSNSMKEEVPGFLSISIVDIATGATYSSVKKSGSPIGDVTELNKLQTSAIKYALKGLEYIHHDESETKRFEDIIITLDGQIHIMMTGLQSLMSYVIIDSEKGNIALAQTLHKKYYNQSIQDIIAEFGEENAKKHPFFQSKDVVIDTPPAFENETQAPKQEEKQKRSSFLHDLFFSN